jgi:hypothetical protein
MSSHTWASKIKLPFSDFHHISTDVHINHSVILAQSSYLVPRIGPPTWSTCMLLGGAGGTGEAAKDSSPAMSAASVSLDSRPALVVFSDKNQGQGNLLL